MIIGTAGHVDHGKTSLVRALTGVDTDRLAEEKARGISIELGFAYAQFDDGEEAAEPFGFIDVPGHRKFVQTMIAGAAGIDLALLVIAADDGPMPQTREHLAIMQWLGVSKLVVALSKVDAVDAARAIAAEDEIDRLLATTPYRGAKVMPVSTVDGRGLAALKALLIAHRDRFRPVDADSALEGERRFRLAIDRAFVLQGIGLVVTGTCFSGRVAIDDQLTLLPGKLTARVRGIHAQNQAVREAHAGQRVALNLVGRGIEKRTVHRGDWIVAPTIAIETDRIDVQLMPAIAADANVPSFDARNWRSVRFHAGASSCNARVVLLEENDDEHRSSIAQIVFEQPMHLVAGDRFVLRDASRGDDVSGSIAGGVVLDVDVPARRRRSEERLRFLKIAAAGDRRATLAHAVETSAKGIALERWNVAHNTTFEAATVAGHAVGDAVDNAGGGITVFSSTRWDTMLARLLDVLAAEHARAPDAVGPGRDRLRRMAAPSMSAATFGALIDAQKQAGHLAQTGAWLHLPEHRVAVSPEDRRRFDNAVTLMRQAPESNNPPRIRDLARELGEDEAALRTTFIRFASLGEVYRVAHDHYFLPEVVRQLARAAREVAEADGVARAAPFRDRIGVGRKVAIQILEFFDRVGYTRRIGDDHRVIQPTLFDA
jgi:selenocysteine-specific elongation factor